MSKNKVRHSFVATSNDLNLTTADFNVGNSANNFTASFSNKGRNYSAAQEKTRFNDANLSDSRLAFALEEKARIAHEGLPVRHQDELISTKEQPLICENSSNMLEQNFQKREAIFYIKIVRYLFFNSARYKRRCESLLFFTLLFFFLLGFSACKNDEQTPTPEVNPFVGTWYEVGSTENIGVKVTFSETYMSAYHYTKDYVNPYYIPGYNDSILNDTIIYYWEDDVIYKILSNEKIQFDFPLVKEFYENEDILNYLDSLEKIKLKIYIGCSYMGINKTQFTFNEDTLFIRDFIESKYLGMEPIYLIREVSYEN